MREDELGAVMDIIATVTRYHKTYSGKVLEVEDELSRGRVRISIPELGWILPIESPWVEPEYAGRGCIVPEVDDWVVVYFLAGNADRPVYRSARTGEVKGSTPPSFTGPETRVLYEDADVVILYDGEVVTVNAGPKRVRVKTNDGNLFTVLKAYMEHVRDATTFGSSTSHSMTAATKAAINGDITDIAKVLVE